MSLLQLLGKIQTDCINGISHPHISLTELAHAIKPAREGLFNTIISFPPEMSIIAPENIRIEGVESHQSTEVSSREISHLHFIDPLRVRYSDFSDRRQ